MVPTGGCCCIVMTCWVGGCEYWGGWINPGGGAVEQNQVNYFKPNRDMQSIFKFIA